MVEVRVGDRLRVEEAGFYGTDCEVGEILTVGRVGLNYVHTSGSHTDNDECWMFKREHVGNNLTLLSDDAGMDMDVPGGPPGKPLVDIATDGLTPEKPETVLEEAQRLIYGDRARAYGKARPSFNAIATGWSTIVGGKVTAEQVVLMMIWLKMVREFNGAGQRDNIVDIAGYAGCYQKLLDDD